MRIENFEKVKELFTELETVNSLIDRVRNGEEISVCYTPVGSMSVLPLYEIEKYAPSIIEPLKDWLIGSLAASKKRIENQIESL